MSSGGVQKVLPDMRRLALEPPWQRQFDCPPTQAVHLPTLQIHPVPRLPPTSRQYHTIASARISFYIIVLMDAKLLGVISSLRWVLPVAERPGGQG